VRRAQEILERQVAQLTRLVDDLRDISRIASGTTQLAIDTADLEQVVASAIETCRPLATARDLRIVTAMPPGPLLARGDTSRLVQVVANLLGNAAKFSEVGGCIAVSTALDHGQAVLRVKDTGVGIPRDMLDRVFEPFTQVDRLRDGALGGMGLGLTLVKRLVQLHGGTVTAHSDGPGLGSEFVVRLPAVKATPSSPPAPATPDPGSTPASEPGMAAPVRHVLVVDGAVEAERLSDLLTLQGHQVLVAHDGLSGLDTALRDEPEIVFLELNLPKMNGLEVAQLLRGRFGSDRMLLVALIGSGQPVDRRRIAEAGFDHHLSKPLDPSAVRALLAAGVPG
jgi:CheY-like chemotaxis protein/two-component sensor histidine kinase